ncbi:MAG: acyl-CoA thioesterase [Polyangiaceae bacterium]
MTRYSMQIEVEDGDLDELSHVSNVAYVRWISDVATRHSASVGLPPLAYRERGAGFVVRSHHVEYLRPVLGGTTLRIDTRIVTMRMVSSERETLVHAEGGALHARALSVWAFIDFASGKPTRIPPDVRQRFDA